MSWNDDHVHRFRIHGGALPLTGGQDCPSTLQNDLSDACLVSGAVGSVANFADRSV
jgi:hypothetical protein